MTAPRFRLCECDHDRAAHPLAWGARPCTSLNCECAGYKPTRPEGAGEHPSTWPGSGGAPMPSEAGPTPTGVGSGSPDYEDRRAYERQAYRPRHLAAAS